MTATNDPGHAHVANPTQNAAFGFVIAFLVSLFLILALPLFSGAESALSRAGAEELGPFVVLVGVIVGFAHAGRRSPLAAGLASGIIALISIALALTTTIVILLASLLDEFVQYDFGGGMWAVAAASVLGIIAVILSAQHWRGLSPPTWTPVAVVGSISCVAMIGGLAIPEQGFTLSDTLGFTAHPVVGIAFTAFLTSLALVGVAGFAFGRWGVGLLAGFIGYVLIGWATSTGQDQSTAFGWSGVKTGIDFHPVTVVGFWTATAMFAVHAFQQLSGSVAASSTVPAVRHATASSAPATWAVDPYGYGVHRYWNGRKWTNSISDTNGNVLDAPATPRPPTAAEANWYPDPLRRHEHRYFDGAAWTSRVANVGVASTDRPQADPPLIDPAPSPATPPPSPKLGSPTDIRSVDAARDAGPTSASSASRSPEHPAPDLGMPTVVFGDGRRRELRHTLIVGRSPAPVGEYPDAELLQVADATVSKTHAAIGRRGTSVWVRDLHSSNGVTIDDGSGERPLPPDLEIDLASDQQVVIGDQTTFVIQFDGIDSTIPRDDLP